MQGRVRARNGLWRISLAIVKRMDRGGETEARSLREAKVGKDKDKAGPGHGWGKGERSE